MRYLIAKLITLFLILLTNVAIGQNIGIGTNTPKAALDVTSTTNGFLPPRMTFTQRANITNPTAGLMVWCIDCGIGGELSFFDGNSWKATSVAGASAAGSLPLTPADLIVTVSSPLLFASLSWTDVSTNEIGYKIERKTGNGTFTQVGQVGSNITNFNDSSISQSNFYTYRVYAYNYLGNSAQYSNLFQITTYALPTIKTGTTSNITGISANCNGTVINNGGTNVTSRGVCWSTAANPTIALSTKTIDSGGIGSFSGIASGLNPTTTYHVRAYATNAVGTAYGADSVFTTLPIFLPTVTTNSINNLTISSASCGGNVSFDGNTTILAKGVCWDTISNPTIALNTKTNEGIGSGIFTSSLFLLPNKTYYVRAYASNSVGTAYGTQIMFTTPSSPPLVPLPFTNRLFIIGGATDFGWNMQDPMPAVRELARLDETTWAGIYHLNGGSSYLLLPEATWNNKFAVSDNSVPGAANTGSFGYNFPQDFPGNVAEGDNWYKMVYDFQTGTYNVTKENYPLGQDLYITGNALPSGWTNTPPINQKMTMISNGVFEISVPLIPGRGYQFINTSGQWIPKFGGSNATGGELGSCYVSGTVEPLSIPTPSFAGNYKIRVNFISKTYSVTLQP